MHDVFGTSSGWGGWLIEAALWAVFWGALITWIVLLVRRPSTVGRQNHTAQYPAEQILADRYARGEIDADELRTRQAVLHETTHHEEETRR
ncbi:MAG TPA: SHOCT domain-containing protein [Pseudonocardiaceae bacterium]|nr:SHOCT domain-containing protein [Pseudonocardiaceae bacterium]